MRNYRVQYNYNAMGHPRATRSRSPFRVTRKPFGIRRVKKLFPRIIGLPNFVYSSAFVVETRNVRDSTTSIASFRPVSFASLYSVLSSRGTFHRVPKIAPKCPSENGSFVARTIRGKNIRKEELVVFSASRLFVGYQRIANRIDRTQFPLSKSKRDFCSAAFSLCRWFGTRSAAGNALMMARCVLRL